MLFRVLSGFCQGSVRVYLPPFHQPIVSSVPAKIIDPACLQSGSGGIPNQNDPAGLLNIPARQKRHKKPAVELPDSSDSSDSSDSDSSSASSDDDQSEDELAAAIKVRKAKSGVWGKYDPILSASEAVILSETALFWDGVPDKIASVQKLGGSVVSEILTGLDAIINKWSSLEQAVKYKSHHSKDKLKKTKQTISATQAMNREFRDTFTLVSAAPGCGAALVNFFSDRVHRVLMGGKPNDTAISKLKAFCKLHKSLASYSFSALAKWKTASEYNRLNSRYPKKFIKRASPLEKVVGKGYEGAGSKKSKF